MTEESEVISDPDNYAAMQVPHESIELCKAEYKAFWDGVYALRKKHRISNVFMVCMLVLPDDSTTVAVSHMGSSEVAVNLAAIGFRDEKQRMCERLDKLATVDREKSE